MIKYPHDSGPIKSRGPQAIHEGEFVLPVDNPLVNEAKDHDHSFYNGETLKGYDSDSCDHLLDAFRYMVLCKIDRNIRDSNRLDWLCQNYPQAYDRLVLQTYQRPGHESI